MNKTRHNQIIRTLRKKLLLITTLLVMGVGLAAGFGAQIFDSARTASADSGINSEEQRIISVIYSTFRYQGKYYKAKSQYITKVINYLNRDDIDMSAAEVDDYINRAYRNIRRGIDEGYLYEVERTTTQPDTQETTENPTESPTETPTNTEGQNTETPTQEPSTSPQGCNNTTEASGQGKTEKTTQSPAEQGNTTESGDGKTTETGNNGQTTETATNEEGLPVDETGAVILEELKESDIEPGDGDEDELLKYEENKKDTLDKRPSEGDADTAIIYDEEDGTIYVRVDDKDGGTYQEIRHFLPDGTKTVFLILLIICGVLTLNTLAIGAARKCFIFKQRAHRTKRRGHTKRRKVRKLLRSIQTGVLVIELVSLITAGVMYVTLFRENTIMDSLSSSGFFRYEYARYVEKQGANTDHETYEEFLFHAKSEIRETLKSGKVKSKAVLSNPAATSLYKLRGEIRDITDWLVPCMALGAVLSILILWFLDGIRHRGVRKMSLALGITFVIALIAWTALKLTKPFTNIYVEPDYLYRFIYDMGVSLTKLVLVMGVAAGILAVALFGVARSMKKHLEN